MRSRIEALLRQHANAGDFLEKPAVDPMRLAAAQSSLSDTEQPRKVIGPYKLLQKLGEGGMGVVFMAEQTQPIRRKVALKLIKPGMNSQQVIARFGAERQALAMMDHPNIARVLDAGIAGVEIAAGSALQIDESVFANIYSLAVLIPSLAVSVRRLHDTNRSGWWLFICLVPLIGCVVLFVLMVLESDPGDNQYGANTIFGKNTAATRIQAGSRKQFGDLGVSLVNNYQGRGINVGFGQGCDISDADVPALGSLDLQELYLSRTSIGDESVAPLGAMGQLQVLDVSSTLMSRDGIRQLNELLPAAKIVG